MTNKLHLKFTQCSKWLPYLIEILSCGSSSLNGGVVERCPLESGSRRGFGLGSSSLRLWQTNEVLPMVLIILITPPNSTISLKTQEWHKHPVTSQHSIVLAIIFQNRLESSTFVLYTFMYYKQYVVTYIQWSECYSGSWVLFMNNYSQDQQKAHRLLHNNRGLLQKWLDLICRTSVEVTVPI